MIPANYSQVNLIYRGSDIRINAENAFGIHNPTADPPGTVEAAVFTCWTNHVKALFTDDIILDSIRVKNGPDATGPFIVQSHGTAGPGGGQVLPGMVCALVTKSTNVGGRRGRGRLYHPGVFTGMMTTDSNVIAGATVTAVSAAYNAFLADLDSHGYPMVLLHTDATTPTPVTSMSCQSIVATQRRRVRR